MLVLWGTRPVVVVSVVFLWRCEAVTAQTTYQRESYALAGHPPTTYLVQQRALMVKLLPIISAARWWCPTIQPRADTELHSVQTNRTNGEENSVQLFSGLLKENEIMNHLFPMGTRRS